MAVIDASHLVALETKLTGRRVLNPWRTSG